MIAIQSIMDFKWFIYNSLVGCGERATLKLGSSTLEQSARPPSDHVS